MIETERLILRPFELSDATDLYEYLKTIDVNCFACMKLDSPDEAERAVRERMEHLGYYLAITLKDSGKVIGEIEGAPESMEPQVDEASSCDTYSLCWLLNKDYQGKGYAYEAAHAFFEYLFNVQGARRLYAYTEDYNISSQRLCEKLGMRREGVFMEFVSFVNNPDGTPLYENTCQYAILKKEWERK